MRKSRFNDSQIMAILKQAESGVSVADLHAIFIGMDFMRNFLLHSCKSNGKLSGQTAIFPIQFTSSQHLLLNYHPLLVMM